MKVWIVYDGARYSVNATFASMLRERFEARGATAEIVLTDSPGASGGRPLPDLVVMRTVDPDMTRRFEQRGVPVQNNSDVATVCNDKWATYRRVSRAGIPIPATRPVCRKEVRTGGFVFPVVVKSRGGHGGKEVFWCDTHEELTQALERVPDGAAIVQKPVSTPGVDVRVYIVGDRIVAAMQRRSTSDFRSNYSLGGVAVPYNLSAEQEALVRRVMALFRFGFVGIDFMFDRGRFVFNEIEDVVGCRMVYATTTIDIADIFVEYALRARRAPHVRDA